MWWLSGTIGHARGQKETPTQHQAGAQPLWSIPSALTDTYSPTTTDQDVNHCVQANICSHTM